MQSLKRLNSLRNVLCPQITSQQCLIRPESTNSGTTKNLEVGTNFVNRNPRNLEKMRIGYKPDGYHVDRPGKTYWHKLQLSVSVRYVSASIHHFQNGEVLKVSTNEWALKKQLYTARDTSAFINLARVLAHRCLQCGLTEISCFIEPPVKDGKVAKFLQTLEENGITLKEPPQFKPAYPWDQHRPEKPWEVTVD